MPFSRMNVSLCFPRVRESLLVYVISSICGYYTVVNEGLAPFTIFVRPLRCRVQRRMKSLRHCVFLVHIEPFLVSLVVALPVLRLCCLHTRIPTTAATAVRWTLNSLLPLSYDGCLCTTVGCIVLSRSSSPFVL